MVVKKYSEGAITIEIDEEKCNADGECVNVCPTNVFEIVDGKSKALRIADCIECCACVDACPTKAIKHHSC
ncbi:MAG: ferredoxin [Candidatus Methanoperedens nitroreducens]|uniref:Ferredoxin n=1 Tax=Candidatus Methanoperedens nitratireducens TaxID=1392998 RepID=A0A0P8A459_9EURY|nr:4Fe-4S binding protein [Candidatus Methanoperedens sp. BLZ2]KAB2947374.1 MAG: 4Fe-4S dicluster domain-containing protein [Candidatus Methanoperedens sp.]KPQ41217.1 MAG: ferredoxin [Candidatus Methanoperedens sp. BLZ1]MBZ0175482.1 4Fe-4S binding protein [Candidatus Methanoperedens nitroreducens]VVB52344.1 Zinc-containing ferredoxin-1 [uncultured archaeon]MCX9080215.1 4Fe-4S binding protein [Candidatus Methanoperedens sp.]